MAYRFVQDGDFVNFFDSSQLVIRVHKTSRSITWFYNDSGGLTFAIDQLRYQTDAVSNITFNGTPLSTQAQFKTKIIEFFPDLAGGGGGETGGIDDVLAEGQALTADREIDLNGNRLTLQNGQVGISLFGDLSPTRPIQVQNGLVDVDLLHIDITPNSEHSVIKSLNTENEEINVSYFEGQTTEVYANFEMQANFGGQTKLANINGHADATASWIEHAADQHIFLSIQEFADNAAAVGGGLPVGAHYRTGDVLKIVHE